MRVTRRELNAWIRQVRGITKPTRVQLRRLAELLAARTAYDNIVCKAFDLPGYPPSSYVTSLSVAREFLRLSPSKNARLRAQIHEAELVPVTLPIESWTP